MLALVLNLGDEKLILELPGYDVNPMLDSLKISVILDSDGGEWIINPYTDLYFEAYPPHFEIDCKTRED